jgi:hypothetical protein
MMSLLSLLPSTALAQLSIAGEWRDAWNTDITISSSVYVSSYPGSQPSIIHITAHDDAAGYFVGQNSGAGSYNPGKWSRVDWVKDSAGGLHLCTTHYKAATQAEAMIYPTNRTLYSHANYATNGCGGFAFSSLTAPPKAPLLIAGGDWKDNWGTIITVSTSAWVSTGSQPCVVHISHYDNAKGFLVGQNEGPGCYDPGKWSRVDWVIDTADTPWYCQTHFNAGSKADAMKEGGPTHNHSAYATNGCNGFGFSALTPLAPRVAGLEPSGWTDSYGTELTLGYEVYVSIYPGSQPNIIHITQWNETETFFVGKNSGGGSYYPGQWSRVDWVKDTTGMLHLCTTTYAANTEAQALIYPTVAGYDKNDVTSGCNNFPFSSLSKPTPAPLAIAGEWVDTKYQTDYTISSTAYVSIYPGAQPSLIHVTYYDNLAGYLVGQNFGPGNYYPGKWSRIDWVVDTDDDLHLCSTHYNAPNASAAKVANAVHDHALYASTGCGGFPFSSVSPKAYPSPSPMPSPMPSPSPSACPTGCVPAATRRSLLFGSMPVTCPIGCVPGPR